MLRSHCDRCDARIEDYSKYVELDGKTWGVRPSMAEQTLRANTTVLCESCTLEIVKSFILYLLFKEKAKDMRMIIVPKCDGNHAGPRCADPECWNQ